MTLHLYTLNPFCHIVTHVCNLRSFSCPLFGGLASASIKTKSLQWLGWGESLPRNRWEMIQNKTVSRDTNSALSFGKKNDFFIVPMPKSGIKFNYSVFISFFLRCFQLSEESAHSECSILSPHRAQSSKE